MSASASTIDESKLLPMTVTVDDIEVTGDSIDIWADSLILNVTIGDPDWSLMDIEHGDYINDGDRCIAFYVNDSLLLSGASGSRSLRITLNGTVGDSITIDVVAFGTFYDAYPPDLYRISNTMTITFNFMDDIGHMLIIDGVVSGIIALTFCSVYAIYIRKKDSHGDE